MTFGDALEVFKTRMEKNPALKPRTKEYCRYRISALLKSWPGLAEKDASRISNTKCLNWSVKNASRNSSSSHNYTVSIVHRVFVIAIESDARYDNSTPVCPACQATLTEAHRIAGNIQNLNNPLPPKPPHRRQLWPFYRLNLACYC